MSKNMNVIDNSNQELDSEVTITRAEGKLGLHIHSSGGNSNRSYNKAFELIIDRLKDRGYLSLVFYKYSNAKRPLYKLNNNILTINNQTTISLHNYDSVSLRKLVHRILNNTSALFITSDQITTELEWESIVSNTNLDFFDDETDVIQQVDFSEKRKALREMTIREGQPQFREALLEIYNNTCAISGTKISDILEAAHIIPYEGKHSNHITNGLLLRSDIHRLFDLGQITIDENYTICIHSDIIDDEYRKYHGRTIKLPSNEYKHPNKKALKKHSENQ